MNNKSLKQYADKQIVRQTILACYRSAALNGTCKQKQDTQVYNNNEFIQSG